MKRLFAVGTLLIGLLSSHLNLSAQESIRECPATFSIGPEIYGMKRHNEGGAKQQGTMYGVRLTFEYLKRHRFYWGLDGLWAQGYLNGKIKLPPLVPLLPPLNSETTNDFSLLSDAQSSPSSLPNNFSEQHIDVKSRFTDANVEWRLGFTFQTRDSYCFTFTPFVGLGYFWEYNHYEKPVSHAFHFDNEFLYVPFGFLSQVFVYPNVSLGLNFKTRWLVNGHQKVSHDPDFPDHDISYEEKFQYRGELPVSYYFDWNCLALGVNITPFYEYRNYGARVNFPQDFHETNYQLYGATGKFFFLF